MKLSLLLASLLLLLAACAPASTPDLAATAQRQVETWAAGTWTAEAPTRLAGFEPSNTPLPEVAQGQPTETPTHTPEPSQTSAPTRVDEPTTATIQLNEHNKALLRFENNSGQSVYVILDGTMHGEFAFSDSWNLTLPRGNYIYCVWIAGEGPYEGTFSLTNADKHTLRIDPNRILFLGP
jgi:hypothetical protein